MLEKYGVDMSELPVTDEQRHQLAKYRQAKVAFDMPSNRQAADDLLQKLAEADS